jgi:hypothetical protein
MEVAASLVCAVLGTRAEIVDPGKSVGPAVPLVRAASVEIVALVDLSVALTACNNR